MTIFNIGTPNVTFDSQRVAAAVYTGNGIYMNKIDSDPRFSSAIGYALDDFRDKKLTIVEVKNDTSFSWPPKPLVQPSRSLKVDDQEGGGEAEKKFLANVTNLGEIGVNSAQSLGLQDQAYSDFNGDKNTDPLEMGCMIAVQDMVLNEDGSLSTKATTPGVTTFDEIESIDATAKKAKVLYDFLTSKTAITEPPQPEPVEKPAPFAGSKLAAALDKDGKPTNTLGAMRADPAGAGAKFDGAVLAKILLEAGAPLPADIKPDTDLTQLPPVDVDDGKGGKVKVPAVAAALGHVGLLEPLGGVIKPAYDKAIAEKKPFALNDIAALIMSSANERLVALHPEAKGKEIPAIVQLMETGLVANADAAQTNDATKTDASKTTTTTNTSSSGVIPQLIGTFMPLLQAYIQGKQQKASVPQQQIPLSAAGFVPQGMVNGNMPMFNGVPFNPASMTGLYRG